MKKSVFLFDIDDTCYNGFSQGDLMKAEVQAGFYTKEEMAGLIADLKEKYQEKEPYEELAEAYVHDMAKILAGKSRQQLYDHAKQYFASHIEKLSDFLPAVLAAYADTHDSYFISCGFDYSVQAIASLMGVSGYVATTLQLGDGLYRDVVVRDLAKASDKAREAKNIMERYPREGSIAFGDSSADAGMMQYTQQGICVHPKPELEALARQNGWRVVQDRKAVFAAAKEILG